MKDYVKFISRSENFAYVNSAANPAERERRKAELKKRFDESGKFSNDNGSWVQAMGGAVEDIGNEEFSFMNDTEFNFEEYNKAAKAETAIFEIKRLARSLTNPVKDSIKQYLTQRNSVIKKNRERQKEKEKAKQNPNVSKPFWY